METIKITSDQAHEMQLPFLKSAAKKRLGITGFQFLRGWYVGFETEMAFKISAISESGTAVDKDYEEKETWIPKSQSKVFEFISDNEYEDSVKLIFVKSWLYNENKSEFKVNEFENHVI